MRFVSVTRIPSEIKESVLKKKSKALSWIVYINCIFVLGVVVTVYKNYYHFKEADADAQKKDIVYQMYADYKKDFPEISDMSPKEAMTLLDTKQAVFVDTRGPQEMKISTLPNAISEEEFLKNPKKFKDKTIIGYCTISYRSGKFAQKMAKEGFQMYNLTGGILAWVLEGGKVYDTDGESRRIHVYGRKWNYPAGGYEAIW